MTAAKDTATPPIASCLSIDVVEGQLAVCLDIVVALVKVHRHTAAGLATVLDDSLGQRLDLFARNSASALKEGADAIMTDDRAPAIDAHDLLAVLVPAAVRDVGGDLPA